MRHLYVILRTFQLRTSSLFFVTVQKWMFIAFYFSRLLSSWSNIEWCRWIHKYSYKHIINLEFSHQIIVTKRAFHDTVASSGVTRISNCLLTVGLSCSKLSVYIVRNKVKKRQTSKQIVRNMNDFLVKSINLIYFRSKLLRNHWSIKFFKQIHRGQNGLEMYSK